MNNVFVAFLQWFFVKAPGNILRAGRNFLLWGWKYFSIGYFVPRLLAPWHRDISSYGRGFDFKRFFHVWGWNLISRVIGAILRSLVMAIGAIVEIFIGAIVVLLLTVWFVVPLAVPGLLLLGVLSLVAFGT